MGDRTLILINSLLLLYLMLHIVHCWKFYLSLIRFE
jgi:hypothetical protein